MIRRIPQVGDLAQARAKITLRTSGPEEFYIPPELLEDHRIAQKVIETKKAQDELSLKMAKVVANAEAKRAKVADPLQSHAKALE